MIETTSYLLHSYLVGGRPSGHPFANHIFNPSLNLTRGSAAIKVDYENDPCTVGEFILSCSFFQWMGLTIRPHASIEDFSI